MFRQLMHTSVRPMLWQPLGARGFAAAPKHHIEIAKVIPFAADKVWAEVRDFVAHTKHFGLDKATTHANPGEAASDAVGCIRSVLPPDGGAPMLEECVGHSDENKTFSIKVVEPNSIGITDYHGDFKVTPLSDGTALATYSGDFNGADLLPGLVNGFYRGFMNSIESELAGGAKVVVERAGPAALSTGRVAGKVAVVTGGAAGLGEAICRSLAAEGATVVVVDRNAEAAKKIAADIPGGHFAAVDVTSSKEVASLFEDAVPGIGRLDIVVNNAGIAGAQAPTHEHPLDNWDSVINVNLNGAFYVLRSALAVMQGQSPHGGVVINMTSTVGLCAFGNLPAYTAAKGALVSLTRSTAVEYAAKGIRVCAIAPTVTMTPLVEGFMASASPEISKAMMSLNPMPGMPVAQDVAQAALFLCSDDAKWVSGSVLPVDGAYCAGNVAPHSRG